MNASTSATSLVAMVLCVIAAASPAGPWSYTPARVPTANELLSLGMSPLVGGERVVAQSSTAYTEWHGGTISVVAGVGFLFLLATSPLVPVPWWRTLVLAGFGAAILTITLIWADRWRWFPVKEWGALAAIVSSVGLLVIAALETRQLVYRQLAREVRPVP